MTPSEKVRNYFYAGQNKKKTAPVQKSVIKLGKEYDREALNYAIWLMDGEKKQKSNELQGSSLYRRTSVGLQQRTNGKKINFKSSGLTISDIPIREKAPYNSLRVTKNYQYRYRKFRVLDSKQIQVLTDREDKGCRIRFVNCGQGDAILFENAGKTCLIDFGNGSPEAQQAIDKAMRELGVTKINQAVLTHLHDDHAGVLGTQEQKDEFGLMGKIDKLMLTDDNSSASYFVRAMSKLSKMDPEDHKIISLGETPASDLSQHNFKVGNMKFEVLGPSVKDIGDDNVGKNNNSVVLKMTYKGRSILLTGDIQRDGEKRLIEYCNQKGIDLKCDVLKLSHHGAPNCNSQELFDKVNPKVCVASLAKNGRGESIYGRQMNEEMTGRIESNCSKLYRTDEGGTISLDISTNGRMNIRNENFSRTTPSPQKNLYFPQNKGGIGIAAGL